MPGHVPYRPTDAVHWAEVPRGIVFGHPCQPAQPFAARKTKLIDKWMCHDVTPAPDRVGRTILPVARRCCSLKPDPYFLNVGLTFSGYNSVTDIAPGNYHIAPQHGWFLKSFRV